MTVYMLGKSALEPTVQCGSRGLSVFRTRSRGLLPLKWKKHCSTVSSVHPAKPPNTVNPVLPDPAVSHLMVCYEAHRMAIKIEERIDELCNRAATEQN